MEPRYTDESPESGGRISIGEVARELGVTVETVRNWERAGKISAVRTPGGQRRFLRADVDALKAAS